MSTWSSSRKHGGLYGLEHEAIPGVVESLKIITEKASTRIATLAFEHARKTGRKEIDAIHKANIMKLSDGLFENPFAPWPKKFSILSTRD